MKINDFILQLEREKEFTHEVSFTLQCLINPANDEEHDLTAEEMATIDAFADKFCQALSDLTRQAFATSSTILRQKLSFKDISKSVNIACTSIWHDYLK